MHVAVRAFPGNDPVFKFVCGRVEVGLSPQLAVRPGFRMHVAVCCSDRLCLSMLAFDTRPQLLDAVELSRDWARVHLADLLQESQPTELLLGEDLLTFMRPRPPPC